MQILKVLPVITLHKNYIIYFVLKSSIHLQKDQIGMIFHSQRLFC